MTLHALPLSRDGITPEITAPEHEKLIAGDPVHTTWNAEDRDGIYCGIWQSTPGKWRISYAEWEYMRILEGVSVVTNENGVAKTLRAGDSWIIRPGFEGTWEVLETTVKDYVIVLRQVELRTAIE
ncbi:cupin domain-containing protein [Pseudorhodobacter sp.]|uniref:cupin domain-containing protein n=1 Tax=Pseudorhodobacter sp. TaxID=1934400 RepID=UPI0026488437|nr:cupin domain-containing protein [Pseudorhodobacter sp.]MDN5786658.1 cupin domain-containing protein [Pseudorhodobacter sp.]